jgi:hypothetical protein
MHPDTRKAINDTLVQQRGTDHHRAERDARFGKHPPPGASIFSDEGLIARLLYHLTVSHVATADFALANGHSERVEPSRDVLRTISDVRERLFELRHRDLFGPAALDGTTHDARDISDLFVALELAWAIIANAGEGDWTRESPEWQAAAKRWRDEHFCAKPPGCIPARAEQFTSLSDAQWKSLTDARWKALDATALQRLHDRPAHNED